MEAFIFIFVIIWLIILIISILSYAFTSFGLYKLGKNNDEVSYPLAWIPYLNQYLIGKLAFKSKVHAIMMVILNVIVLLLSIFILFICRNINILYIVSIVNFIISIIVCIYSFIARYKIYSQYSGSTIIMTILDIISFGILSPLFIFAIRNNNNNN